MINMKILNKSEGLLFFTLLDANGDYKSDISVKMENSIDLLRVMGLYINGQYSKLVDMAGAEFEEGDKLMFEGFLVGCSNDRNLEFTAHITADHILGFIESPVK